MASSKSNKRTKISELNQDLISSLPTDLTEEILKHLPMSLAAKMSVLSRKWRRCWLSLKYLVFDKDFWLKYKSKGCFDWPKVRDIITNILLHHNGPVHEFNLYIPDSGLEFNLNLSQWLSFLSRAGIRSITLVNLYGCWNAIVPSHIFTCNELVNLKINYFTLKTPPSDFIGFAYLRNLELRYVQFEPGVFSSLISSCQQLTALRLEYCFGLSNLDFEHLPNLEDVIIKGIALLAFKNVFHLRQVSLTFSSYSIENASCVERFETVSAFLTLAIQPVKLQYLHFDGILCKFLAAGCNNKPTRTFNHLQQLCLTQLNLEDLDVFCFIIGMVQSCPLIKDLELSITPKKSDVQHKFDYDGDYKLGHLLKAKITGISGSNAELKLIEYVLGISVVLEKLMFKFYKLDSSSELKVLRELLQFPRASTKAKLVCLA